MTFDTTITRNFTAGTQNAFSHIPETVERENAPSRWNSIGDIFGQPYLIANTAMTLLGGFYLTSHLFSAGFGAYADKIASGDQLTLIQSGVSVIALLCGTMGMKMLADQRNATKNELKGRKMEKAAEAVLNQLNLSMSEVTGLQLEIVEMITTLNARDRDAWHTRPNNPSAWNRFAGNFPLVTIGGHCSSELRRVLDASGGIMFRADRDLVRECWLPRFTGDTKLSRIDHIIFMSNEDATPDANSLNRVLATYRITRDIAEELGIDIDLENVRIALVDPKLWPQPATFLGYKRTSGRSTSPTPFVMRYSTIPLPVAKPLNDEVEVNFSPDNFARQLACADDLLQNATCSLNLEEAENRFGDKVPDSVNGTNRPIRFSKGVPLDNAFDHYGEYYC